MQIRNLIAFLALAGTAFPAHSDSELVLLYYDLEIASYCGLVDDQAVLGFQALLAEKTESEQLTKSELEQARMQAWKDAHREWENRGLGGFRSWCKNEAAQAAQRLRAHADSETKP